MNGTAWTAPRWWLWPQQHPTCNVKPWTAPGTAPWPGGNSTENTIGSNAQREVRNLAENSRQNNCNVIPIPESYFEFGRGRYLALPLSVQVCGGPAAYETPSTGTARPATLPRFADRRLSGRSLTRRLARDELLEG